MARVGIAVEELPAPVDQHVAHAVADEHAAERQVAGGHAFCEGHEIRSGPEVIGAEPGTQPPETRDHLVRDQQDAVLVTDPLHLRPIAVRRDDTPPAPCTGSPMKAATLSAPASLMTFSICRATAIPNSTGEPLRSVTEPVRLIHVHHIGQPHRLIVHGAHAAQRRCRHGRSVVRVLAADDDAPPGLLQQIPVPAHHAHDRVVGFRAGAWRRTHVSIAAG